VTTQPGASLVKATLAIHEPPIGLALEPGGKIMDIDFQFNPTDLTLAKSASWSARQSPNFKFASLPNFQGVAPSSLSFKIFLDSSMTPTGTTVQEQVEALLKCCEVTDESIALLQPSPPWVFFQWGSFSTVSFNAYMESISANYTYFNSSGIPLRATCDVTIKQMPALIGAQNPTSGALAAHRAHRVVAGDTLQSLAHQEYGDATAWRTIAEANGIDDPLRLEIGRELLVPSPDQIRR
jgi:Contractile injection system tube protein/LysM domain